jgi:2-hydroxychromene-2-carboxylate isomerase
MSRIHFFYDYVSVYSYLANSQLESLEGVEVVYRPMLLGAVMQATGNRPPASIEAKKRYLHTDIADWARHYKLPLRMNPQFPQNTIKALRMAIVAQRDGGFPALHRRLFAAMWEEQQNLEDEAVLTKLVNEAGLPAESCMQAIGMQQIKDQLKANTEEAVARGAFGAPTFFVGDRMFFGNDRFEFIREALGATPPAGHA